MQNMEAFNNLISLIRAAVFEKKVVRDISVTTEMMKLAKQHDLLQLLYPATDDEKYRPHFLSAFKFQEMQDFALEEISGALTAQNISHIPLKGAVLRSLYPKRWMRACSDVDILVKETELKTALDEIKNKLHYRIKHEGKNDIVLISPNDVVVELHFKLFNEDDVAIGQFPNLEEEIWKCADGSVKAQMPDEYFYLYHILHMKKHFIYGGCGIGFFIDLKLLDDAATSDTRVKRDALLEECKVKDFEREMLRLAHIWFADDNSHEKIDELVEKYIILGGKYGTFTQMYAFERDTEGSNTRFIFKMIFMPYQDLCVQFPQLREKKYLTPFYEIRRWLRIAFNNSARQKQQFDAVFKNQDDIITGGDMRMIKESLGL